MEHFQLELEGLEMTANIYEEVDFNIYMSSNTTHLCS